MQVVVPVVGHVVVSQDKSKHGGGTMWQTVPSRKKKSGKSGRKVEIKKNIPRLKGRQSQLSQLEVH